MIPHQLKSPFSEVLKVMRGGARKIKVFGLSGSSPSFFLSEIARDGQAFCLLAPSTDRAETLFQELSFFLALGADKKTPGSPLDLKPFFFPPWDILPYEPSKPRPDRIAQRLSILHHMALKEPVCIVTTIDAFLQRVPSKSFLLGQTVHLQTGETLPLTGFTEKLVRAGYERTGAVTIQGEFSIRGGILDLYPASATTPLRIEFFGDEIESIRTFDPETQRSEHQLKTLDLGLSREDLFNANTHQTALSEYLLPEALLILDEPHDLLQNGKRFLEEAEDASVFAVKRNPKYPKASSLYLPLAHLSDAGKNRTTIDIETLFMRPDKGATRFTFETHSPSSLGFSRPGQSFTEASEGLDRLRQKQLVMLIVKNQNQATRFQKLLTDHDIPWTNWDIIRPEPFTPPSPVFLKVGTIAEGFSLSGMDIVFLTEEALTGAGGITGRHHHTPPSEHSGDERQRTALNASFEDFKPSDYVVHIDHGVGRYIGVKRLLIRQGERAAGYESDFIVIEYSGKDKVYVPLDSLNLVQKYVGLNASAVKIDKLGGSRWAKTKARVRKEIKEMTQELLELYANREVLKGHAFATPDSDAEVFAAAFEYDETPDQMRTIQEVIADMEKPKPMDRLVCGDVGYGKTEVAMRAAFHAVMDGKQVAMVVPTTLLAEQHHQTFARRFSPFPVEVAVLSRFISRGDQRKTLTALKKGQVDILIGTHRILQKDVAFRDLGLIVVDEEHRFGVRHKEWLKQKRKEVDVLTLTATPIPRTLQMALAQVRDLSVIETPPADRLAIRTIMAPFDPTIIREVVFRELVRGGQVFFLHNRVHNVERFGTFLSELLPEAKIGIAHGQMPESMLEKVMHKFLNKEYNLLLTTTIIESGIDIPSANTIIINDADRFGLSQLYQLRGRVGRSGEQAYAYLLVREDRVLTEEARQRLQAIQEFTDLGSGFRVAARDLEIRGAGSLLGHEQSGQIAAIGFELYLDMINEMVRDLQGTPIEKKIEPSLHFRISAFIPEDYISDSYQRLSVYRRLSSCDDLAEIQVIREEMEDRYGTLPDAVQHLLQVIQLKGMAKGLKITKLEERGHVIRFSFDSSIEQAESGVFGVDPLALLSQFQGKIQFIDPYSFELGIKSTHWDDIYLETALCLKALQERSRPAK